MSNSISVRVAPITAEQYAGQRDHDMRLGSPPGYVDPARSHRNSVIVPAPDIATVEARLTEVKKASPCRQKVLPKNIGYTGVLTFSRDAQARITGLSSDEIDRRITESVRAIAAAHHVDVISLAVHRDESAVHAHYVLSSVKTDTGRTLRLKKRDTSAMQDIAAQAWADLGISRGRRIADRIKAGEDPSKTIHRSVARLHADLPAELEALERRIDDERVALDALTAQIAEKRGQYKTLKRWIKDDEPIARREQALERREKDLEEAMKAFLPREQELLERIEGLESQTDVLKEACQKLFKNLPPEKRQSAAGWLQKRNIEIQGRSAASARSRALPSQTR